MDSVEEEILIRKRLKQTESERIGVMVMIPLRTEMKELLQIVRPLYIHSKVEEKPLELTRSIFDNTMYALRFKAEIDKVYDITSKYDKFNRELTNAQLVEQISLNWYRCMDRVVRAWNKKYVTNLIDLRPAGEKYNVVLINC
jgi:hypothetical protein